MYWTSELGPLGLDWGIPILAVSCLIVFALGELAFLGYWGIVKPFLLISSVCKKCIRCLINLDPTVRELEQWTSPSPFDTDKQPALRPDQPSREGRTKRLTWIPVGNIEKGQLKQVPDEAIVKALVEHPDFFTAIGPVKVRSTNTGYILEYGLNRWQAAKRLSDAWPLECEVL